MEIGGQTTSDGEKAKWDGTKLLNKWVLLGKLNLGNSEEKIRDLGKKGHIKWHIMDVQKLWLCGYLT